MAGYSGVARLAAGLFALATWAGLGVQFQASWALTGSGGEALWAMARYFTVISNLLLALVFTVIAAAGRRVPVMLVGGVTMAMLLVGVIYGIMLQGLLELSGGAWLADVIMHKVTPVLAVLFWLVFTPKGRLSRADPWIWAIYPLVYLVYALIRAGTDGKYPYPFLDAVTLGWATAWLNAVLIAASFIVAGHLFWGLDKLLGRSASVV